MVVVDRGGGWGEITLEKAMDAVVTENYRGREGDRLRRALFI